MSGVADAAAVTGVDPVLALGIASAALLALSVAVIAFRSLRVPVATKPEQESTPADEGKRVTLLFGTQTGTAERFAKELTEDLKSKYGHCRKVQCTDLEDFDFAEGLAQEDLAIFLLATYGDGEPTDGGQSFHTWLVEQADACDGSEGGLLAGLTYAVFGLGNTQYEHFNAVAKQTDKALNKLGARRAGKRGEGDDDVDIEDDFSQWCEQLFPALEGAGLVVRAEGEDAAAAAVHRIPSYEVVTHDEGGAEVDGWEAMMRGSSSPKPGGGRRSGVDHDACRPFPAEVKECRELHAPASERSCVHVEIDIAGSGMRYEHGDHLGVMAENDAAVVAAAAKCLGLRESTLFELHAPDGEDLLPVPFPGPVTLGTALARYADLLTPPRKAALLALASHAEDAEERARLELLASHAGKDDYAAWVHEPSRSLVEVMHAFPSARPPLGVFFAAVSPRLAPRLYSISSSPKGEGGDGDGSRVTATVAVVRGPTPTGRVHEGVCSTWLARARAGDRVPVFVRSAPAFRLPACASSPIVMIGPGTGLAPFRGFLQERAALKAGGASLGPAVLFFGCRDPSKDYIYEAELAAFREAGTLSDLHVAFSRVGKHKDYVQHHLEKNGSAVWPMLRDPADGGRLYVCGDAKMAKDVNRALLLVVQAEDGCSADEAEERVKAMQGEGRYLRDVW